MSISDMESAEGMIPVMRQAGLEPNDDTFVTLMCGYARKGDMDNVNRIVRVSTLMIQIFLHNSLCKLLKIILPF